jgi:hypothetical protein
MRKLFLTALLVAAFAPAAFAQTGDDYNKYDVFVGFSHNRVDTGIDTDDISDGGDFDDFDDIFNEREGFNGVNASVKGNVSRYAGLKFDYSFHRKEFDFGDLTGAAGTEVRIHNFLGGVELKDNARETRVKPFAHLLAGVARQSADLSNFDDEFEDVSETGFAAAIGGGVDFRLNDRVDFRAIQFDYNPNRLNGETQHNFRIGIGVVFR